MEELLFDLNRGSLRQAGLSLPIDIEIFYNGDLSSQQLKTQQKAMQKKLLKALKKAGLYAVNASENNSRYVLKLNISQTAANAFNVRCDLNDTQKAVSVHQQVLNLPNLKKQVLYDFARNLGDKIFVVDWSLAMQEVSWELTRMKNLTEIQRLVVSG